MDEKFRRPLGVGPKNEGEILHHKRGPIRSLKMCVCVCVCFFSLGFVLCWVLFFMFLSRSKIYLSSRIWLLPTNYHKERDFATILVFVIVLEK